MKGVYVRTEQHREHARGLAEKYCKGKPSPFKGKKGLWTHTEESKKARSEKMKGTYGIKNPHWKGGLTSEYQLQFNRLRSGREYKEWRKTVLERDGHKCVDCGSVENLETHHIKSFHHHPELRLDVTNGQTLCKKCHIKK